ncbi:ATP-binding protein [Planctomycetes bacterium K23_9]|uniref:sensor histidine kinase n=1 Tax=Stieleria marina TaxID=1930275 RepID=UPI0011A5F083
MPLIGPARLGSSPWLLHLRTFAIVGQLMTILAAGVLTTVRLPYTPLLSLVGLTAVTNLFYGLWLRRLLGRDDVDASHVDGEPHVAHFVSLTLMLLDLITLTAMLYFSGGADNPFSFFYFVNLAVGGLMIRPRAAWLLTLMAVVGYTFLLQYSVPIEQISTNRIGSGFDLRSVGLMLAFAACASVVTYFVTRTSGELQQRERQLRKTQAQQAASHRLEGLTTLAAGAAHELATPLSTIDVIVRELSRHLDDVDKPESVDTDLKLIDGQLEMCKQILQRMRSAAGDSMAQRWDRTTVGDLIDTVLEGIRDPHLVDVIDASERVENHPLWLPQEALAQAVRNLVHNGLDASGPDGRVSVESQIVNNRLQITVSDQGQGMSAEVLARASDPFFTTKEPGRGIGLGLFLTRNVVSQLGGLIDFKSQVGQGTRATVILPLDMRPPEPDSANS